MACCRFNHAAQDVVDYLSARPKKFSLDLLHAPRVLTLDRIHPRHMRDRCVRFAVCGNHPNKYLKQDSAPEERTDGLPNTTSSGPSRSDGNHNVSERSCGTRSSSIN